METTKPAGDIYFSVKKRTQLSDYSKPRQFKAKVMPRKIKNEIQLKQPRAMGTPKDFALVPKLQNQATKKLQAVANKRKAMQQAREAPPVASLLQAQELKRLQEKISKMEEDKIEKNISNAQLLKLVNEQPDKAKLLRKSTSDIIDILNARKQAKEFKELHDKKMIDEIEKLRKQFGSDFKGLISLSKSQGKDAVKSKDIETLSENLKKYVAPSKEQIGEEINELIPEIESRLKKLGATEKQVADNIKKLKEAGRTRQALEEVRDRYHKLDAEVIKQDMLKEEEESKKYLQNTAELNPFEGITLSTSPAKGKNPSQMRQELQDAGVDVTKYANLKVPPAGMTKQEMMESLRDDYVALVNPPPPVPPPTGAPPTGAPVTGYGLNLGHLYGGAFTNALIQKNATTAIKHLKAMDKNHPDIKHWMKVKKASSDKLKDMIKAHGGGLGDTIKKHLDGWIQKGAKWYWNHLFPPKEDAQYNKYRGGDLDADAKGGSFTSMFNNFSNGLIRGLTLGAVNI